MATIVKREGVNGIEWMFRHNGQLYVFKTKAEAEIEFDKVVNGSLF